MKNIVRLSDHRDRVRYHLEEERNANVIGRRIKEARKANGYSLEEFRKLLECNGVKVSRFAVNKWEQGETVPSAYQLVAIFHALGLDEQVRFFMNDYQPELNSEGLKKVQVYKEDLIASGKYVPSVKKTDNVIRYVDMRVSNLAVSAGIGEFLDEDSFETVPFPEGSVPHGADFGVRIAGDSMEPVYHDGQIVWVQECSRLTPGQVGVFVYDGAGYLKVYDEQQPDASVAEEYTDSYGNVSAQPVLVSYNQKYAPKVIRPEAAFQIIGRVL